eukprot:TRINITY_DN2426_c0_g2_i1.p1 TRINITY_DN2426_c0_g2~~TRINITY_DN2426_c0_g2_i1.p1  ORF type:complete len:340 (+),score=43.30 TRINITY_DN2426_c0_g2_i1:102-1121(+)
MTQISKMQLASDSLMNLKLDSNELRESLDSMVLGQMKEKLDRANNAIDGTIGSFKSIKEGLQLGSKAAVKHIKDLGTGAIEEALGEELVDQLGIELGQLEELASSAKEAILSTGNLITNITNLVNGTKEDIEALTAETNELLRAIRAAELVLLLIERLIEAALALIAVLLALISLTGWFNWAGAAAWSAKLASVASQLEQLRNQVRLARSVVTTVLGTLSLVIRKKNEKESEKILGLAELGIQEAQQETNQLALETIQENARNKANEFSQGLNNLQEAKNVVKEKYQKFQSANKSVQDVANRGQDLVKFIPQFEFKEFPELSVNQAIEHNYDVVNHRFQ